MGEKKSYGKLRFDQEKNRWIITEMQPHTCIKFKNNFIRVPRTAVQPYYLQHSDELCADLFWFMQRYDLSRNVIDDERIKNGKQIFDKEVMDAEAIYSLKYKPREVKLIFGEARSYQLQGKDLYLLKKRLLIGDDLGLGKTLTAILAYFDNKTLPGGVVCQPHLCIHWKEQIEKFTLFRMLIISKVRKWL